jgi:hypothetical protein
MHLSTVPGTHAVALDSMDPPRSSGLPKVFFTDMMDAMADESHLVF